MKMYFFLLLIAGSTCISCASSKNSAGSSKTGVDSSLGVTDGSNYEKAIVIDEKTETKGVAAEYIWIRKHYPEANTISQRLEHKNGKAYDLIMIQTPSGLRKEIYFNISKYFGKY